MGYRGFDAIYLAVLPVVEILLGEFFLQATGAW
jgi:hypothetical protein